MACDSCRRGLVLANRNTIFTKARSAKRAARCNLSVGYGNQAKGSSQAKRSKSPLPVTETKPHAKVINLMDALKRSVSEAAQTPQKTTRHASRSTKKGPTLVKSRKRPGKAA